MKSPYKDRRWKKVAKRIRKRDRHRCQSCGRKGYHVHHLAYEGANIWDTPDHLLETRCDHCHRGAHGKLNIFDAPRKYFDLVVGSLVLFLFGLFILSWILPEVLRLFK